MSAPAALAFRAGWGEVRPVRISTDGRPLPTALDDLRQRYWAAMDAEMAADPCTPERAILARRCMRLARLMRAVRIRGWA